MPEGDTVWLAAQRLRTALVAKKLIHAELRHPRLATIDLTGTTVTSVASVGKHILIRFDNGTSLHSHFLMDGSWHLYSPGAHWRGPEHQVRAVLAAQDRVAVGFRLHQMKMLNTSDEKQLLNYLGPDLLAADWDDVLEVEAARRLGASAERELGQALLDQRVMAGIGNLYKTEVCFLLGVSPWSPSSAVDPLRCVQLSRKLLLANADRPQQSTTGALRRGMQHWVFERVGLPCRRCGTTVRTAMQGTGVHERLSYLCTTCQPGPHPPLGGRATTRR